MKISEKVIKILKNGGVGVLPTDTIYGLVGSALNKRAVERIYQLKKRSPQKPFIILIANISDLKLFGVRLVSDMCQTSVRHVSDTSLTLKRVWPGKVSVVLQCPKISKRMSYLQPLKKTLAFRLPKEKWLNGLLEKTGPLVAPSANWEGEPPAENIQQAKRYFGERVDFYVNTGKLRGKPSTLAALEKGKLTVLRQGKVKI